MRALYIDEHSDPDPVKLSKHGITALYLCLRDPRVTREYLQNWESGGLQVGVYAAWNWPGYEKLADKVDSELRSRILRVDNDSPRVILNDESQSGVHIAALLKRWRELYPNQATALSTEGMQGGWLGKIRTEILAARVRLQPQSYLGNMERIESASVVRDLTKVGFPEKIISPALDAAALGHWWDGFAFTQGRLPA